MSVTQMSRRDSRVTHTWCHKGCHTTPTRPDPTRPISVVTAACGVSGQSPHASLRTVTRAHRNPSDPTSATATSLAAQTMHAADAEMGGGR